MQKRNPELVDILRTDFQHRNEPNFAWKSAVSAFMALPLLRAFWPMSSVAYTNPQARSIAGSANHLTNNNVSTFGYSNLVPYVNFNGTTQSLTRADGGAANWADIRGNETYVVAAQRGLTLGGWFMPSDTTGIRTMISKWAGGAAAYQIDNAAANTPRFLIFENVATTVSITSTTNLTTTDWWFVVGRFVPSTSVDVCVNNTWTANVAGIPATIDDAATQFCVGAQNNAAQWYAGKQSMVFLCASALSDSIISALWEQTRAMFGV